MFIVVEYYKWSGVSDNNYLVTADTEIQRGKAFLISRTQILNMTCQSIGSKYPLIKLQYVFKQHFFLSFAYL